MAVTSNPGFRGHCEGLCPNKGALSSRPTSSGRCWKASTRVLEPDATMTLSPIDKLLPEITRRKAGDHRNIYSPSSALSVTSILSSPSIFAVCGFLWPGSSYWLVSRLIGRRLLNWSDIFSPEFPFQLFLEQSSLPTRVCRLELLSGYTNCNDMVTFLLLPSLLVVSHVL